MAKRKPAVRDAALAAVRALVHTLYRSARGVEAKTGRTNAQIALLAFVVRRGPLTISEIARLARARQNTVSTLITRLERAGLVRRSAGAADRRVVFVDATSRGRRLMRRAPTPATEQLLSAIDALTPAQAAALTRALSPLLTALHRKRGAPPMLFE